MHTRANRLMTDLRNAPRARCRVFGTARYLKQQTQVRILNVSRTGLAMEIANLFNPGTGSSVVIESEEIGLLEGTVRWKHGAYLGIQFNRNSNSSAKVDAYFKNAHQEVRPVLRG